MMKLYNFFRSDTSHRLRIALNLKGLAYEYVPVDLRSEQHMHPINNRRVLETLRHDFGADDAAVNRWCATWIGVGFDAIEALLATDLRRGEFCFGNAPTVADVYLVPQVESARCFKVDLARWPRVMGVDAACARLEEFRRAAPALQPDAS